MAGMILKYWNGRGLMEVPRKMLAISGKFPVSVEKFTNFKFDFMTNCM